MTEAEAYKNEIIKYYASKGMIEFGGSFFSHIGAALACAHPIAAEALMQMFEDECKNSLLLWRGKHGFDNDQDYELLKDIIDG